MNNENTWYVPFRVIAGFAKYSLDKSHFYEFGEMPAYSPTRTRQKYRKLVDANSNFT